MITQLTGKLKSKKPTEIILDVNGVGYLIYIPFSTFEKLPIQDSEITILTQMIVREDAIILYGFLNEEEREMFKQLISISGIGPKIAQTILSGISSNDLQNYILNGNVSALVTIPGIGRKTAERIIIELKDKTKKTEFIKSDSKSFELQNEALNALQKLGFSRNQIEKALNETLTEVNLSKTNLSEVLKICLKKITS